MEQEMTNIPTRELEELRLKADLDEELLVKLVRGLEDVRKGNVKDWDEVKTQSD